ncbi:hypothetical protein KX928_12545 [Roseobacter sp. YSTF-M11]|uniref:Uncharacterized protein n=1 Tax=Roseobacter insulae TaxID=2859783 RepID=A0A9X1K2K5_9RHOB|nr:hypothetical protein [Roseobacter insulae]MBW4708613.1 hypothetical protein [Roseobacter insulae]
MITLNRTSDSIALELATQQASAIVAINEAAGAVRAQYITIIPGQEMLYPEKRDEARAYVAEPTPPTDLSDYELLEAEIGITAPTIAEVAQVILNLYALWKGIAAPLETFRLGAINSVEAATSQAEIDAAVATFMSQLEPPG